jgi:hypothetical protein
MEMNENSVVKKDQNPNTVAGFQSAGGFELMQRQANMLAQSQLVPKQFQGKVADCCIALEMAARIGASPFQVLQNIYIVHGKPTWSATFLVAAINACGRFSPLRYRQTGEKGTDSWGVIAWAKDLEDGEVMESPEVTISMAKVEGWYDKNGSKWQTIPELMLRYRAATFFARTYCPDVTMGMMTQDEVKETVAMDVSVSKSPLEMPFLDLDEPEPQPTTPTEKPEIDVTALAPAALVAAINRHKKADYFAEVLEQFGAATAQELTDDQKRECLTSLMEAEQA